MINVGREISAVEMLPGGDEGLAGPPLLPGALGCTFAFCVGLAGVLCRLASFERSCVRLFSLDKEGTGGFESSSKP